MLASAMSLGQVLAEDSAKLETVTVNRSRRYLPVGGSLVPSVTTALSVLDKPALIHWSGTVERELCVESFAALVSDFHGEVFPTDPDVVRRLSLDRIGTKLACYRKRDEAGETGTAAHALIEYHLKRRLGFAGLSEPEVPPGPLGEAALWAYLHFEEYAKGADLEPVAMEIGVWSAEGFAGRLDLLAYVNGRLSILDWKTGKDVYAEAHLQNAAYRCALNERLSALGRSERVTAGHIVLLPKQIQSETSWRVVEIGDDSNALEAFRSALRLWRAMDALKKGGIK